MLKYVPYPNTKSQSLSMSPLAETSSICLYIFALSSSVPASNSPKPDSKQSDKERRRLDRDKKEREKKERKEKEEREKKRKKELKSFNVGAFSALGLRIQQGLFLKKKNNFFFSIKKTNVKNLMG